MIFRPKHVHNNKNSFLKNCEEEQKKYFMDDFYLSLPFYCRERERERDREREREREQSRVCLNYPKFERNPSAFLLLSQPYPRKNTFVYYTEKEFL